MSAPAVMRSIPSTIWPKNQRLMCETISATNPCGEQPLPPYGACLLGSINLAALVSDPFTEGAALDHARLAARVKTAVRFCDGTIDVARYPLPQQRHEALAKRRIGLGVTGLADALVFPSRYEGFGLVPLEAMGVDPSQGVLRLSFTHYTTRDEIDRLLAALDKHL